MLKLYHNNGLFKLSIFTTNNSLPSTYLNSEHLTITLYATSINFCLYTVYYIHLSHLNYVNSKF